MLVVAGLLLVPAYLVSPPSAPPLYDGLGFPDEPYRYVSPPPDAGSTAPPTAARTEGKVYRDGSSPPLNAATGETGPQAAIAVPQGALDVPADSTRVVATVEPVPLPRQGPQGGIALSNAYDVAIEDDRGNALRLTGRPRAALIQLRIPAETAEEVVIQLLQPDGWVDLTTRRSGVDVYSADLVQPGVVVAVRRYDLVASGNGQPVARSSGCPARRGSGPARRSGTAPAKPVA